MGSITVIDGLAGRTARPLFAAAMRCIGVPLPNDEPGDAPAYVLRKLAEVLGVRCALFGTIDRSRGDRWIPQCAWIDGQLCAADELPDDIWPLGAGGLSDCLSISARARHRFPDNPLLAQLDAETLIALRLRDIHGELLGGVAVIDDQPCVVPDEFEAVIALLGMRIGQWLVEGSATRHLNEQASRLCGVVAAAKETVNALTDSEERLRMALDAGAMGIWDWDLASNEIIATSRHAALFCDHPELGRGSYRTLSHRIHPEDRRTFEQTLWDARERRSLFQHEFRVMWPDGSVRWISARGRYFFSPEGRAVRLLGLTADITEHKRAEEALRESESRFRGLFETMTEGAAFHELVHDENGMVIDYRIVEANPAFGKHTGLRPAQVIGGRASALFGNGTAPFLDTFRRVAQGGEPASFSGFIPALNRNFDISAFSPGWGRFVTIFEDATERHQRQEEEKQRQEALLKTAGVITMGEMASAIAHELNQPLTAIAAYSEGCVQRWQDHGLDADQLQEVLGEIRHEALRAAEILRSVRKFVQRHEFAAAPLQINQIIERVAHFTETQRRRDAIAIQLDLQPDLPLVRGDEILLEIVVLNLVRNGLEAMSGTPPTAARLLRIVSREDENGRTVVSVLDNGPGVAESAIEEIFGAYVTSKAHGMGLGLAISRSIIESHGGQLNAENNATGGASFTFRLDPALQGAVT